MYMCVYVETHSHTFLRVWECLSKLGITLIVPVVCILRYSSMQAPKGHVAHLSSSGVSTIIRSSFATCICSAVMTPVLSV